MFISITGRDGGSPPSWAEAIVRGDEDAIDNLVDRLGDDREGPWPVLPKHTIHVAFGVGEGEDLERQ